MARHRDGPAARGPSRGPSSRRPRHGSGHRRAARLAGCGADHDRRSAAGRGVRAARRGSGLECRPVHRSRLRGAGRAVHGRIARGVGTLAGGRPDGRPGDPRRARPRPRDARSQDRAEPAAGRSVRADGRRPRGRSMPARPPAGRAASLRRVARLRRRPRPDAPGAAGRDPRRARRDEPVPPGPRRLLDLPVDAARGPAGDPAACAAPRAGSCPVCGSASRARSRPASGSPRARCASSRGDRLRRATTIEAFYDLDLVNQFHEPSVDADHDRGGLRGPRRGPTPSRASRTSTTARAGSPLDEAHREVVWPGYRTAIERIRDDLSDPERAAWFELTLDGNRRP